MPRDLNFVGLVVPPDGAVETKIDQIGDIFKNELTPLPSLPLNPVAVEERLRDWLPSIDNHPALMRRLTANLVYQSAANMPLFVKTLADIEGAIRCVCDAIQAGSSPGLTATADVISRPANTSVTFGQPAPDVFAAGWIVWKNELGQYGQRQFIYTDRQVFRSDIPGAVGYDTYVIDGFDIIFS